MWVSEQIYFIPGSSSSRIAKKVMSNLLVSPLANLGRPASNLAVVTCEHGTGGSSGPHLPREME